LASTEANDVITMEVNDAAGMQPYSSGILIVAVIF